MWKPENCIWMSLVGQWNNHTKFKEINFDTKVWWLQKCLQTYKLLLWFVNTVALFWSNNCGQWKKIMVVVCHKFQLVQKQNIYTSPYSFQHYKWIAKCLKIEFKFLLGINKITNVHITTQIWLPTSLVQ